MIETAKQASECSNISKIKTASTIPTNPVDSFPSFFFGKFSVAILRVESKFTPGQHLETWCARVQAHQKTLIVSSRKHLKTTVALGFIAWQMWRQFYLLRWPYREWLFMAYKEDLAQYQLKRLNRYILALPEIFPKIEKATDAETIIRFKYSGMEFICEPAGILGFKRGRAPNGLVCDDILKDPTNPRMSLSTLEQVERIFFEEVESLPKERLHIFGTPQDENDLFAKLEKKVEYWCGRFDAMQNEARREALWPEEYPFDRLEKIKASIGEKAFAKEYRCRPVRSEESFFTSLALEKITKRKLKNYSIDHPPKKLREYTFAGFDLGKKTHPSHLAIFAVSRHGITRDSGDFENRIVQVHSKWMDGWDYKDQLEYLTLAIERFKITMLLYDNTRGEFEAFREQAQLPAEMEPFVFGLRNKGEIATKFDEKVSNETLWLVHDDRQRRQLLTVDNDYQAMQTSEGHGDCFFSIGLAIRAWFQARGVLIWDV